jgi:hypothetical protein
MLKGCFIFLFLIPLVSCPPKQKKETTPSGEEIVLLEVTVEDRKIAESLENIVCREKSYEFDDPYILPTDGYTKWTISIHVEKIEDDCATVKFKCMDGSTTERKPCRGGNAVDTGCKSASGKPVNVKWLK